MGQQINTGNSTLLGDVAIGSGTISVFPSETNLKSMHLASTGGNPKTITVPEGKKWLVIGLQTHVGGTNSHYIYGTVDGVEQVWFYSTVNGTDFAGTIPHYMEAGDTIIFKNNGTGVESEDLTITYYEDTL